MIPRPRFSVHHPESPALVLLLSRPVPAYNKAMVKKFLSLIAICLVVAGAARLANQRSLTRLIESEETTHSVAQPTQLSVRSAESTLPVAAVPVTDTIPPNPPNGMIFSGSGPFQLYRQGNLTWRVDTGSGRSCILFATDAEWRKPRVYQRGCATS